LFDPSRECTDANPRRRWEAKDPVLPRKQRDTDERTFCLFKNYSGWNVSLSLENPHDGKRSERRPRYNTAVPGPLISIILPVHNEAERIVGAINHLQSTADCCPIEVIVVDAESRDPTGALAERAGARCFMAPVACRSRQMALGAQQARGDFFVFLHVDTRLPDDWQSCLHRALISPPHPPAAVAFRLAFDTDAPPYPTLALLAHLRGRLTGIPQGDQALALARTTYEAAGGFPDVPLMEEYLFIPKLRRIGRVDLLPERAVTSVRRYERNGPIRTALRNTLFVGLFYLGVPPQWLARRYGKEPGASSIPMV